MLIRFISFFLDEWVWNMTWGWYQIMYSMVCTWLFFCVLGKIRMIPSLCMTFLSYAMTFIVYTIIVVGISMWDVVTVHMSPYTLSTTTALLGLGGIYSVLQSIMMYGMRRWHTIRFLRIVYIMFIGHAIGAGLAYCFLKIAHAGMVI
jgi:hypothetical protein